MSTRTIQQSNTRQGSLFAGRFLCGNGERQRNGLRQSALFVNSAFCGFLTLSSQYVSGVPQNACEIYTSFKETQMCTGEEILQMFAVMEVDDSPVYIGSFEECDEFLRLSGIVPLEGLIVPLESDAVAERQDSNGFTANRI